jgi:tetratricopeptide (TPR) repeat protein
VQGVEIFYRRALKLDPLNVGRYGALGLFLAVNDDYDGARAIIERMKALFDSPEAFRAIAQTYNIVGDVDHAIAWTIKARDAEPSNPEHIEKLAEYFVDIGDFETAESLTPDLGVGLLYKMRRFDKMIDKAEELYFDYPEDIRLKIFLASAYSITGKHDQAVRLIKSTGIMDTLPNGNRGPDNWEAYNVLINAAYGGGKVDEARDLITWSLESIYHGDNANWWVSVNIACESAILGDDENVYRQLNRALDGLELAWVPRLMDFPCFQRFADDPAYLAVIDHFDGLRKMLRARLPSTLAQYGVSLD